MTWLALTATLTLLGSAWTVYAARNRGAASALRGAGITLLVPALYLTDTLDTLVDIGAEIASWATGLVFSPTVWLGIVLAGVAALLLGASSVLRNRAPAKAEQDAGDPASLPASKAPEKQPRRGSGGAGGADDDLAEIEELLRRRGIT